MSDQVHVARAARQRRIFILLLILATSAACLMFAVRNTFYDMCTTSFDRDPRSVVTSYLAAISRGDLDHAQNCWVRAQYFAIEAGCSEICLQRAAGTNFTVQNITLGEPYSAQSGRAALDAEISVACADGSQETGSILLDAVAGPVPWKHWRVNSGSAGGSAADPWCR